MPKKYKRKRVKPPRYTPLTISQILEWADEYHRQTGRWPVVKSPNIGLPRGEKWSLLDNNLRLGQRDLPKDWSLAKLLAAHRSKRNSRDLPPLTIGEILAWADAFHARTGQWPRHNSGPIPESSVPEESWSTIEVSLVNGRRGLPAGYSVARLLVEHRNQRNRSGLPRISEHEIVRWAKAYHRKHGEWPSRASGPIESSRYPGDTWLRIDQNLRSGHRGLEGGSSLDQLLAKHVGKRSRSSIPPLTESQILTWADAFHAEHGHWPTQNSGNDALPEGESWKYLQCYLDRGMRGLPGGSSLAKLLATHRKARNRRALSKLSVQKILGWADAWFKRSGSWPLRTSGPIPEAAEAGDLWKDIDNALRIGLRGLPPDGSLSRLLEKHRGVPRYRGRPPKAVPASQ
jgi:hypothetical protein